MLIRIEDPTLGSVQIATPDNASMGKTVSAITQAICLFATRYDGRDHYDFLSVLYDRIKNLRELSDGAQEVPFAKDPSPHDAGE